MTNHTTHPTIALLVIDAQESFRHQQHYFSDADMPAWLSAQNRLIEGFVARGLPVVRILHVEDDGNFSKASGFVRPITGLAPFAHSLLVEKNWHSALAGTALAGWLVQHGITRVVVSGIRTEQCCETTTRDASDRGWNVDYVTEATLTFAMTHRSGRVYTPAEIRERTELVLDGRFAHVCTVDEALARTGVAALAQAA